MTPSTPRPGSFNGCRNACRINGAHTLIWGDCEHATDPDPTISMSRVCTAADGQQSIAFDRYTTNELAALIEPALRKASLDGGYDQMARAAAEAIVHRRLAPRPAPREEAENDIRVEVDVHPSGSPAQLGDQVARAIRRWRRGGS